jgi:hypothetical protein
MATKKSATKKSATKKSATKKSATKKSATKKSATKKSARTPTIGRARMDLYRAVRHGTVEQASDARAALDAAVSARASALGWNDVEAAIEAGERGTALFRAAYRGHADIAEILLEAGARTDVRSQFGLTPAEKAARAGHAALAS